jgi:hypothetical protein
MITATFAGAIASCAKTGHSSSGSTFEEDGSISLGDGGLFENDGNPGVTFGNDASRAQAQEAGAQEAGFTGPLTGPFTDFPASPVLDMTDGGGTTVPSNASDLFGSSTQGAASGGPCLIEPEVGSLYPNNWLRPRFVWTSPSENIFELRVHADNQTNDLVVYTTDTGWTMPKAMWLALAQHSQDVPMTVSVRGGLLSGTMLANEALGSSGAIGIAPVSAPGTIVYWAVVGGQSGMGLLKGFRIGDEDVGTVLTPAEVQERPANVPPCIGCHASTPDGLNVGFSLGYDEGSPGAYTDSIATLGLDASPGLVPTFLTSDGRAAMDALGGIPAYSPAHWSNGDRVVLLSDVGTKLNWVNLQGTGAAATGVIARGTTDTGLATDPSWSHDGTTIVYTSAASITNGRQQSGPMDLYSVPYNNGAGGTAAPIAGASLTGVDEYYPALSPDDKYVVYNSAPTGDNPYSDPKAQLYLVPSSGAPSGLPLRLDANDPPVCTNPQSPDPDVTNSWAKWSPSAQYVPVLGNTYYWVVFSSTRYPVGAAQGSPQLYISAVVVDSKGNMTTYHSLYLWNQPADEHNHTPAWDYFQIPPPPPPPTNPPPIPK